MRIQSIHQRQNPNLLFWQRHNLGMDYAKWQTQFLKQIAKSAVVKKLQNALQQQLQLCTQQPDNDMARATAAQLQMDLIAYVYQKAGLSKTPQLVVVSDPSCKTALKQPPHGRWVAANIAHMHNLDMHKAYLASGLTAVEALASQCFTHEQATQKFSVPKLNWHFLIHKNLGNYKLAYHNM